MGRFLLLTAIFDMAASVTVATGPSLASLVAKPHKAAATRYSKGPNHGSEHQNQLVFDAKDHAARNSPGPGNPIITPKGRNANEVQAPNTVTSPDATSKDAPVEAIPVPTYADYLSVRNFSFQHLNGFLASS